MGTTMARGTFVNRGNIRLVHNLPTISDFAICHFKFPSPPAVVEVSGLALVVDGRDDARVFAAAM